MENSKLSRCLADNLVYYRKQLGLTQAELGGRINYSDKSVSKWERGDGTPDIFVLAKLAEIYNINVGDFLVSERAPSVLFFRRKRIIIPLMCFALVWLIATVAYIVLTLFIEEPVRAWLIFLWALPIGAVVLEVFSLIWWGIWLRFGTTCFLIITLVISLYFSFSWRNMYMLFLVAGIAIVLAALFFLLIYKPTMRHK